MFVSPYHDVCAPPIAAQSLQSWTGKLKWLIDRQNRIRKCGEQKYKKRKKTNRNKTFARQWNTSQLRKIAVCPIERDFFSFFFLYISSPKSQAIIITHRSRRYRRQKKWKWQRCLESCVVSSCVRKSSLPSHSHTTRITYTTLVSYSFHAPAQQNISHYLALILPWKTRSKMPWEMWLFHSLRPTSRAPRRKIIFIRFFVGFTAPRFTFHARLVSYFSINTPFWVTGVYNPAAPPYDDAVNTSSLRKTFDPAIYCEPQPNVLPLFAWHTRKSLIICTCSMQIFAHLHMALFITHMADGIISFWISSFFALCEIISPCVEQDTGDGRAKDRRRL